MELTARPKKITFEVLRARLISFVNGRIRNGDFSERGLARILGISQPQIHNVLKGARRLHPELADRLIRKFDMSVLDLLEADELYGEMLQRASTDVPAGPAVKMPAMAIGSHLPPKRFNPTQETRKPPRRETTAAAARAGQAS